MSTILTRAERAAILQRCLNNWLLIKRCYRYLPLLNTTIEDLLDDLGVKAYESLFYYRFKARLTAPGVPPKEQAYKLALTTAHNALTSLVRDAIKRGRINAHPLDWHAENQGGGAWAGLRGPSSATAITTVLDLMATVATELVGGRAGDLLRATVYDWASGRRLTPAQRNIMAALGCHNPLRVRRLIDHFHTQIRVQLTPETVPLTRNDGVWRATAQIIC